MNKKTLLTGLLATVTLSEMAQTDESASPRVKENWAIGGVLTLLAPEADYYDKNLERYTPPSPMIYFGSSWLNGGIMGDRQAQFHLRSGVFNKIDCGFTILQVSRNLYRGVVGVSAGFQIGGYMYNLSKNYKVKMDGYRVEIVPSDDNTKNDSHRVKKVPSNENDNDLDFTAVRIPLLIGAQTNNRLFSLQTGLGLCHTSRFGVQWLVTAGLGPITINYSQNLTPLFELNDGTKAYPSSLTVGFDLWYYFCRFTHP